MKTLKVLSLFTIFLLSVTTYASAPSGVELKLNLEKGKTYNFKSTADIQYFADATLTQKMMSMKVMMEMSQKVADKSRDGIHTIEIEITRIVVNQEASGMTVDYDSDNPDPSNPMTAMIEQQFNGLLNSPATIKVNQQGQIIEKPEETGQPVSIASVVNNLFVELPKEQISKGYSWTDTKAVQGTEATLNLTVSDITKKQVMVSLKSANSEILEGENLEAETNGNITFDRKSGIALMSISNSTVKGSSPQTGEFFMVTTNKQELL